MAIVFNQEELTQLNLLRTQARQGQGYWRAYEYIAQRLEAHGTATTDPVLLWFKGATEANSVRGAFSTLIREYTNAQYELRYGETLSSSLLQQASDAVAENVLNSLLPTNQSSPQGVIPTINEIAANDAKARRTPGVRVKLFPLKTPCL